MVLLLEAMKMETEVRAPAAGVGVGHPGQGRRQRARGRSAPDAGLTPLDALLKLWQSMGIANLAWGQALMMLVGGVLIYLAIAKRFEPLLLVPIGFGAILSNIPIAGIGGPDGLIGMIYQVGVETGVFPLLIFMGVGALTDFGALIAMPSTLLLGAAAQFGIFATLIGALALNFLPGFEFTLPDAAAIAIIGGADGPTAIFLASRLSPDLLGAIAVAAYSYMALVPIIQPPIMRALTTHKERAVVMQQLRPVSRLERILFPLAVLALCILVPALGRTADWHAHLRQPLAREWRGGPAEPRGAERDHQRSDHPAWIGRRLQAVRG